MHETTGDALHEMRIENNSLVAIDPSFENKFSPKTVCLSQLTLKARGGEMQVHSSLLNVVLHD